MRQINSILECLKVSINSKMSDMQFAVQAYSQVDNFKFTDEEKSTAFVKFISPEPNPEVFLNNMIANGSPLPFEPSLVVSKPVNPAADVN